MSKEHEASAGKYGPAALGDDKYKAEQARIAKGELPSKDTGSYVPEIPNSQFGPLTQ